MTVLFALIVAIVAFFALVATFSGRSDEHGRWERSDRIFDDESALRLDLSLESKLYRDDGFPLGDSLSNSASSLFDSTSAADDGNRHSI